MVLLTSVNYWRHPVFGLRRNLDMLTCACSLSYQLLLAVTEVEPAPRNAYLATVVAGLGCYGCSRYYSFVLRDKDISSRFHCGLHVLGNMGNLVLYDSMGVNQLGWKSSQKELQ